MSIIDYKELIDKVYYQKLTDAKADQQDWEDANHQYDLGFCSRRIKAWKSWYFKKNSAKRATIRLLWYTKLIGRELYNSYFIQLFRDGKMEEQNRIQPEAFDVLKRDLQEEDLDSYHTVFYVARFEPLKK